MRAEAALAPNRTTLLGALPLGPGRVGLFVHVGFPTVGVRGAVGLLERLDLGLSYESLYALMNELRAFLRLGVWSHDAWSVAAVLEGGRATFLQDSCTERTNLRTRWTTGKRDFNLLPGLVLTRQGSSPRAPRLLVDVRYLLTFDTERASCAAPLSGVPPVVRTGHNLLVRAAAELPVSKDAAFSVGLGFDVHGRSEDAAFMPAFSIGMAWGL